MKPEKYTLRQGWSALKEARRGNTISQALYRKFADRNAMPHDDEPECDALKTYADFMRYHFKVWYLE